jgi:hypothetical protein
MRGSSLAAWLVLGTACGGSGGAPDAVAPTVDASAGAVAGEITVLDGGGLGHMWRAPVVFGGFPTAPPAWHTVVVVAGACRVARYEPAFCDPPCDGVCVAPGECRAWPTYRSAGRLTIGGLAVPVAVDPLFDGSYLTFGGLPDPLFARDATVTMDVEGDAIAAFTVSARAAARIGIPAFEPAGEATLVDGADLGLAWPSADPTSRVQVLVHSGGAPHGTPPEALLVCDAPDSGALTIPRAAIEAMPPLGLGCAKGHDCAKLGVMRYHRATVETAAGTAALVVGAGVDYAVIH